MDSSAYVLVGLPMAAPRAIENRLHGTAYDAQTTATPSSDDSLLRSSAAPASALLTST